MNDLSAIPRPTTRSKYDAILDEYFPQREGNWVYQLLENTTDSLLLALLVELQIQNRGLTTFPGDDRPDKQEAHYFATESPLEIESTSESDHKLNWGFPARQVTVWGFDAPITVSFRRSGDHRKIPLEPDESPFTIAPEGGLNTSEARFQLVNPEDETSVKVLAL